MKSHVLFAASVVLISCAKEAPPAAPAPAVEAPAAAAEAPKAEAPKVEEARPDLGGTVAGVAAGSKDHTTLVAALKAGDLVGVLASPGGAYTVFAPTNAAFDALPKGTVETLLKPENKGELQRILKHHAGVPVKQIKDLKDGDTLSMADGTVVTFHVAADGKVKVDDANIIGTVQASNGVIHVVDAVVVPKPVAK